MLPLCRSATRFSKTIRFDNVQFQIKRDFTQLRHISTNRKIGSYIIAAGAIYLTWSIYKTHSAVYAFKVKKNKDEDLPKSIKLTNREKHFIRFASAEYDGQIYMTPQDFLESFIEEDPRPRFKRRLISGKEIESVKDTTPTLKKGSSRLFRNLRDTGIISYTEYLFLLSILTKPQAGFRIAFNMFDTDGNQRVDKEEFLVILHLLSGDVYSRSQNSEEMKTILKKLTTNDYHISSSIAESAGQHDAESARNIFLHPMEKIFSHAWEDKHGQGNVEYNMRRDENVVDGQSLQRKNLVDTTLLIHFFGKKGDYTLQYEDFRRFMENLQSEVLEMEFQEFAKGAEVISELDFARILLRYTHFDEKVCDMYLERLLSRLKEQEGIPPGITFQEFKVFCQFLNNLEDFTIAMRMYTLADHPISQEEFHRAVKICTGASLSHHLVQTVFAIFDEDGDGQLSYREFIAVMKDRLHRGFKSHVKSEGWEGFKSCIKQEIKSPVSR